MFNLLSKKITGAFQALTGGGRLTESNIQEALREVRLALLEADVAISVIKPFLDRVQQQALGTDILKGLDAGQVFIKIVNTELTHLMGDAAVPLNLTTRPPAIILMAGLQGSGKTTSVGKLGKYLKETEKKSVMVVSCDIYRPAAIEQLKTLAETVGLTFFPSTIDQSPIQIATAAIEEARKKQIEVVLVDTAGRLHIDDAMMAEIKNLHQAINPIETLFVVDSMTGQDAANTAKAFDEALPLTGVILTKTDGDARGGAALSIREITGKPIKFMGVGEKLDALEVFHPERIASRILGMGDVLSLIEEVEAKVDKKSAEKAAKKLSKGQFTLQDFLEQMEQMNNMGGMASLLGKLPGMPGISPEMIQQQLQDKKFSRMKAIILSMTRKERRKPEIINGSRKRRIALGSGTEIQDVNRLLKQFEQMQKMMKKVMAPGGMKNMMRGLSGMASQMGGFNRFGG